MKEYALRKDDEKSPAQIRRAKVMRMNADKKRVARKKEEEKKAIQAKLEISEPGDKHEQQADSVAKKVVGGEDASNEMKMQYSSSEVNTKKEEATLMAKSEGGILNGTDKLQTTLDSSKGSGQALDDKTKSEMGEKMGKDLSDVKIHTDNKAHEMNEGINAKAFTHDQDIYFKQGNFDTTTPEGKELLAHELTHTQQNKNEDVQRKVFRKVEPPSDNSDFEIVSPVKRGVINKKINLLENIDFKTEITPSLEPNEMVALLYQSKLWYFVETSSPQPVSGYISREDVTEAEVFSQPNETNTLDNFKADEKDEKEKEKITNVSNDVLVKKDDKKEEKLTGQNNLTGNTEGNKSGIPLNPDNKIISFDENVTLGDKKDDKQIIPKVNIPEELAKFEAEAIKKKNEVTQSVNSQIAQIKKASQSERDKIDAVAKEKTTSITNSYDNTIGQIYIEVALAYSRTYTAYDQQKARILNEKALKLADLNRGTDERVTKLNTEGERIAKSAESNGFQEQVRVYRNTLEIQTSFDNLIKKQIEKYNVPEREQRLKDRMGALSGEAMKSITKTNNDLIEEIGEDSAEIADNIREAYKIAAEDLPEDKDTIAQGIEDAAASSLEQLDTVLLTPLEDMKKNADILAAQLKTQKTDSLAHVENVRKKSTGDISKEEGAKIQQLQKELNNFISGTDKIVEDVKSETQILPDFMAMEYIANAGKQISDSQAHLLADTKGGTGRLKKVFEKASKDAGDNLILTETNVLAENLKTRTDFRTQAENTSKTLSDSYVKIVDQAVLDMNKLVTDYLTKLDGTVNECIATWEKQLAEGNAAIKQKVDEVFVENWKAAGETALKMLIEAHQTATEWEATYWFRRTMEVISIIVEVIAWIIVIIIAIIVAIILIIELIIPALLFLLEQLVVFIVYLVDLVLPGLMEWIGAYIAEFMIPFFQRIALWFAERVLLRLIIKVVVRLGLTALSVWMFTEGISMLWEMIVRDDLPRSDRVELGVEGFFLAGTAVLSEWKLLQGLFRLKGTYKAFQALVAIVGDAKMAARLVNLAEGDIAMATRIGQLMKPNQLSAILPFVTSAKELESVLALLGNDALRLQNMLLKCTNVTEVSTLIAKVGDATLAEKLLLQVTDGKQLLGLLDFTVDAAQLDRLLGMVDSVSQLELFVLQAGGKQGAKYLEELLAFAGPGNASKCEDILTLVNGDAAWLQRLTESIPKFKQLPLPSANWSPIFRYTEADIPHFLERHTWEYFNISEVSGSQGFWPIGTTADDITSYLTEALTKLKNEGTVIRPWNPEFVNLSNGMTVQVGVRQISGTKNLMVGQFFPVSGAEIVTLYEEEVEAIFKIIKP